jgi:membrane associated rhomboid family serine protease
MPAWSETRATTAIAILTIVVSGLITLTGLEQDASIVGGFIPVLASGATLPVDIGFVLPYWLTPLSATLIHAGFVHLALNLVMLVYCGQQTERAVGTRGIVILYLVGAYAAALGQWAQDPMSTAPMIGASGAISAVLGAYALLFGRSRARPLGPIPAGLVHVVWLAVAWIGIQLMIGVAGLGGATRIAIGAHIGGFLAGLALARPLLLWRYRGA